MNIKFSQLPFITELKSDNSFPILADGDNKMSFVSAIYNYLSGDKLIQVYTSYSSNSSYLLKSANLANSVYTTYNYNSSFYLLVTNPLLENWNSVYNNINSLSGSWDSSATLVGNTSSINIYSDSSLVPRSSAIKNIVAITQTNYDLLTYKNPQTFYVIAS